MVDPFSSFIRTCETATNAGLSVNEARFDGRNFGCWHVEVARKGLIPRNISWQAREGWVLVQVRGSDGLWKDELIDRDPDDDTIPKIIESLR